MAARDKVRGGAHQREEDDPYLRPAPAPPLPGVAPDLLAVLRARRDRALAREEARRWVEELRRRRPDLVWSRPL